MRISDWSSDVCSSDLLFIAILIALAKPMGLWLFTLYEGRSTPLHRLLGPVERGFYRLAGIDPGAEQGWRRYALHMLLFNFALALFPYAILRLQGVLPGTPRGFAGVGPDEIGRATSWARGWPI